MFQVLLAFAGGPSLSLLNSAEMFGVPAISATPPVGRGGKGRVRTEGAVQYRQTTLTRSEATVLGGVFPRICSKLGPILLVRKPKLVLEAQRPVHVWRGEVLREFWASQNPQIVRLERKVLHNVVSTDDGLGALAKLLDLCLGGAHRLQVGKPWS